jgi:hypothetical protein
MSENLARLSDRRESFRDCQCFRVANFIFHLRASVSPTLPSPPPPECNAMNIIGQHKRDHQRGPSLLKPTPLWLVRTYASECQSCVTQIFAFYFFFYISPHNVNGERRRRRQRSALAQRYWSVIDHGQTNPRRPTAIEPAQPVKRFLCRSSIFLYFIFCLSAG